MKWNEMKWNEMNLVLFSTSGVHGTYRTIEDVENSDTETLITFQILQPRIIRIYYGTVEPESKEDFDFLKKLRRTSKEWLSAIGEDYRNETSIALNRN